MKSDIVFSSQSDEWETPQGLYNELNAEFNFNLDPCATKETAKCANWYSKEQDGLKMEWGGVLFVNPPYSQIKNWVAKAANSKATVVMLIPARTDTRWFHEFIYHKTEIRFIKGRLKFSNSKNSAPFPSMIVIFRNNKEVRE